MNVELYKRYLHLLRLPAGASHAQIEAQFRALTKTCPAGSFRLRVFAQARAFLVSHALQGQAWCRTKQGLSWEWSRAPYREADRQRLREQRAAARAREERVRTAGIEHAGAMGWEAIRPTEQAKQATKPAAQPAPKAAREPLKLPTFDLSFAKPAAAKAAEKATAAARASLATSKKLYAAFQREPVRPENLSAAIPQYAAALKRSKVSVRQTVRKANRPFTRSEKRLALAAGVFWVTALLLAGRESTGSITSWKPSLKISAPAQVQAPAQPAPKPTEKPKKAEPPKAPAQLAQNYAAPVVEAVKRAVQAAAPAPKAELPKPAVPTKTPAELARTTIEKNWPRVMDCLASIPKKKAYRGSATYRVSVKGGMAMKVDVLNDTLRFPLAHACVTKTIYSMDFDRVKSAVVDFKSGFELGGLASAIR